MQSKMVKLSELVTWCHQTLAVQEFKDYAPNGLQIEGGHEVKRIMTAVSASDSAIEAAIAAGADVLLVHHGYFWKGEPSVITGMRGQRIKKLIQFEISLMAYHLPLDAHPTLGNNAAIADLLCFTDISALDPQQRHPIGNVGTLEHAISPEVFKAQLEEVFGQAVIHLPAVPTSIKRVGYCTGAAQDYIHLAAAAGCDAYISGEVSERTFYEAQELGLHYFGCGHHATERYGVQRLGEAIAAEFGIEHRFFEQNNPI